MEEKKDEIRSSLRSIFGSGKLHKFFSIPSSNSSNHGFSLVELLVVIGVIGILASAMLVVIDPINLINKSKDGQRKSDMKQIQAALELYRSDQGTYPTGNSLGNSLVVGSAIYMRVVPKDPNGVDYNYQSGGNTYEIWACSEAKNDDEAEGGTANGCDTDRIIKYLSP